MQSFMRSIGLVRRQNVKLVESRLSRSYYYPVAGSIGMSSFYSSSHILDSLVGGHGILSTIACSSGYLSHMKRGLQTTCNCCPASAMLMKKIHTSSVFQQGSMENTFTRRSITTMGSSVEAGPPHSSISATDIQTLIKFKRLDKTAGHIMQILDKEAVAEVREQREIPEIKPGYIIQLKVVVPENKRRVSTIKGIVIARRNAGLNSTFRLRRLVAGVGVESLFPLYSPNIKEIKIVDKKKVRRAKLYYLRDKMNALKKH